MSQDLTDRQFEILAFIARSIRDEGFPPTYREIALGIGLADTSNAAIAYHLNRIEFKGALRRRPATSRGLTITAFGRELLAHRLEGAGP